MSVRSLLNRICGEEPQEVSIDSLVSIVFITIGWSYRLWSCGASETDSQRAEVFPPWQQLAQWQIIALCHQNQPPCQNQLSEQQNGMVWGIINSSVRSCWLILIEVNVGAEKYVDWWGWQEAPPLRRPWVSHLEGSAGHGGLLVSLEQVLAGVQEYWTGDGLREDVHAVIPPCPLHGSVKHKHTLNC